MDTGPIIVQAAVPVLGHDDENTLAARILEQEHKIYPLAVKLIAQGRTTIKNERVLINGGIAPDGVPINPEA
jgi:phosphoribosylglycinamide formyltransferase-1